MDIIDNRKRIEYKGSLKIVRKTEFLSVLPIREIPDIKVVPEKHADRFKSQIPVDHRGYIKCKKHDFF